MSLSGKVFAITGGASGIGLATAKILAERGATVCVGDNDVDAIAIAEKYFTESKASFMMTKVDVSRRVEVDGWISAIVAEFGALHGAANIAGIIGKHHGVRPVAEQDDGEWDRIIAVNLTGAMYCLRAELAKIADKGSIVNVSSVHGIIGFANYGAYDASKHGMIGLTRAAARENGAREVRVNAVAPGAIWTPLQEKAFKIHGKSVDDAFDEPSAIQRQGTPTEVANVIVFLLSPESSFVSGSVYSVDGCW